MDIRFLTTFVEVVKTRHFGKAAENLYLTQSAVSARIKQLEEYFHTTLFVRHRNSIQLTPAGERLLPYAEQLSATLQQAKQELQREAGEYLVCGAGQLNNEIWMPDLLKHIHSAFPEWAIKAEVLPSEQISRQLHDRSIDIAFSSEPLKSEEFTGQLLKAVPLGLFSINQATVDTSPSQFVSIDWGSKARDELLTRFAEYRDAKFTTNSLRLALATLQQEGGIAVLPVGLAWQQWGLENVRCIDHFTTAQCKLYMYFMKSVRRAIVPDVVKVVSQNFATDG
ncbi:LysR family transcriptional regulator [Alteromonas gilva]|uniref:LysR family transcriptional regulator n=1 Tax=Alteromonas gilva TaxID=2987522 RepID=A0ABT5L103_9ALTE|nr:LysR family transcriptional regulator [Alteromonas gilva]MDC8830712.1 LysR family transcriptional regulator [Alteromonas gilva]